MSIGHATLETGEQVDHYRILRRLGGGGFSEAYEAVDDRSGQHVVLKVPDLSILGDPQTFERFRREMAIARRLHHPNIQRALDDGTDRTRPYLVLEYVEGETLREYLQDRLPLSVDEALRLALPLGHALAYAHAHGVAHRDIKPENVLITPDGTVKLFDFGIALLEGARRVTWRWVNNSVGTPDYMAPEQIQGKRGDERTDVYAFGIMLYEMLAGSVPFRGDNPLAVMQQALNSPPTPLRRHDRDVPEALAAVVHKAIRKEPAERYAHVGDMLHDLINLDSVDIATLTLPPERGGRSPGSDRQLLLFGGLVAVGFVVVVAIVIAVVALATR